MIGLDELKNLEAKYVAYELMPEIIDVLRAFDDDEDIQVPITLKFLINRRKLAPFSSMFPAEHTTKGD